MTILSIAFLSGCTEQATAPEVSDEAAKSLSMGLASTLDDTSPDEQESENAVIEEDKEETEVAEDAEESTSEEAFDQLALPVAGDKIAVIETDFGTIKARLFTAQAPEMTKNFEELAKENMYNGVPFHRVVKDFMVQTGDFVNNNGTGGHSYKGPGTTLDDEISPDLKHLNGTLSMANRGPNTNGSQFFIVTNEQGTSFLDGGYTVFGQVYEGLDVALKIADLQKPGTEQPSETVNMTKVEVMTME